MAHSLSRCCLAVLVSLAAAPGCFSEPDTDGDTPSSSTGGATSGPATGDATSNASSGTEPSSDGQSTSDETGDGSSSGSTGEFGSSSSGFGEDESSTGETGPMPVELCPSWSDDFDGAVIPVWESVWPESVEQVGGQTVITLTAEPGDQYPRRVIPWPALGVAGTATVRYRVTPATLPTVTGTQLNAIFEGPAGSDITFSLNNTGTLEYRLTSRLEGAETVYAEQPAMFPPGASIQFEISNGRAIVSVIDDEGSDVITFDAIDLPFKPGEARIGFAATNWAQLGADEQLAVDSFEIDCR